MYANPVLKNCQCTPQMKTFLIWIGSNEKCHHGHYVFKRHTLCMISTARMYISSHFLLWLLDDAPKFNTQIAAKPVFQIICQGIRIHKHKDISIRICWTFAHVICVCGGVRKYTHRKFCVYNSTCLLFTSSLRCAKMCYAFVCVRMFHLNCMQY